MRKFLFIDDIRFYPDRFNINNYQLYIARTFKEAIDALQKYEFDIISFDHDLGQKETGYDIAKYIVENQIKIKEGFKIHSANSVGRFNIQQLLTHYGYKEI